MSDKAKEPEAKEVDFPRPKEYNPPASAKDGKEFTVLATFRIDEDEPDKICLTKIEDVPVSGEEPDETDEDNGPATSPQMMAALQQSGPPAASTS